MRRVDIYISDAITSIDKILSYIEEAENYDEFCKNDMMIDAVIRNYEIIGEVSNKIPKELKDKHPEIPWRQMNGLKNLAIHEYHIVDNSLLWEIATEKLISNKIDFEKILDELRTEES